MSDPRNILTVERLHQHWIARAENRLLVLYFYTVWSPNCKIVNDLLPDIVASESVPCTTVFKINVDKAQDVGMMYNITGVPTFVILLDGQPVDRIEGSLAQLVRKLNAWQAHMEMPPLVAREDQIAGARQ